MASVVICLLWLFLCPRVLENLSSALSGATPLKRSPAYLRQNSVVIVTWSG
ncbi:hypothetical protein J6590_070371 [Homalodisca vitripennis]|nr:hypothetical protein J6590_070371 [Homalodisca vitripennis]